MHDVHDVRIDDRVWVMGIFSDFVLMLQHCSRQDGQVDLGTYADEHQMHALLDRRMASMLGVLWAEFATCRLLCPLQHAAPVPLVEILPSRHHARLVEIWQLLERPNPNGVLRVCDAAKQRRTEIENHAAELALVAAEEGGMDDTEVRAIAAACGHVLGAHARGLLTHFAAHADVAKLRELGDEDLTPADINATIRTGMELAELAGRTLALEAMTSPTELGTMLLGELGNSSS